MADWQPDEFQRMMNRLFPWGMTFANRANLEGGYLHQERAYVERYLTALATVLVIGSGNGREAAPIAGQGHTIVCIDIGEMYLRSGQTLCAEHGWSDVRFVQADMHHLPFGPARFDFVFFTLYAYGGALRHRILGDIFRLVRPGGIVLATVATDRYGGLYPAIDPAVYPMFESEAALRADLAACPCPFEFVESAVDPVRTEYRPTVLRRPGGER